MTSNEQETIRIDCKIPNYERIITLGWSFNETHKLAHLDELSQARHHFENENRTLVIAELHASDSGTYECFAETSSYNYITRINVDVRTKQVQLESKAKLVRIEKGKSGILDCAWWFNDAQNLLFDSNSINSTEWLLNGSRLEIETAPDKYKFLDSLNTLLSVSVSSIGESNDVYNCSIKFKNGTVKISNFTLDIGGKHQLI